MSSSHGINPPWRNAPSIIELSMRQATQICLSHPRDKSTYPPCASGFAQQNLSGIVFAAQVFLRLSRIECFYHRFSFCLFKTATSWAQFHVVSLFGQLSAPASHLGCPIWMSGYIVHGFHPSVNIPGSTVMPQPSRSMSIGIFCIPGTIMGVRVPMPPQPW